MRILFDTNVLIDLYANRVPFGSEAQKFLIMKEFGDAEIWASAKSFTDIFYILSKKFDNNRILDAFEESLKWLEICSVDSRDIEKAIEYRWSDFEDCLIYICAQKVKADYLITRDANGFKDSSIPVYSPQEFFQMLEEDFNIIYDTLD